MGIRILITVLQAGAIGLALAVWIGDVKSTRLSAEENGDLPIASPLAAAADPPPREGEAELRFRYLGAASCSSAGCHGGPDQDRFAPKGREYRIWASEDPHSAAYQTLLTEASRKIASRLGLGAAHRAAECLNCHATPASQEELAPAHRHTRWDGVSCESCHGPAEKWITAHTRVEWRALSPKQKTAQHGFRDTSGLLGRAEVCAACHVGGKGKDVNHDLIAAGHPAMHFDFAGYLAQLPRHWSRDKDKLEHGNALEAKAWAIGKLVALRAAADLTAIRAASPQQAWPEFAEHECFQCHRDLENTATGNLTLTSWQDWHASLLSLTPASLEIQREIETFKRSMQGPYSQVDRKDARRTAEKLSSALQLAAEQVADMRLSRDELAARIMTAVDLDARTSSDHAAPLRWVEAAQRYLATVAFRQALLDLQTDETEEAKTSLREMEDDLRSLRDKLRFPEGFDSPKGYMQAERQKEITTLFRQIHKRLESE